jgi:hypothetical protein
MKMKIYHEHTDIKGQISRNTEKERLISFEGVIIIPGRVKIKRVWLESLCIFDGKDEKFFRENIILKRDTESIVIGHAETIIPRKEYKFLKDETKKIRPIEFVQKNLYSRKIVLL